VRVHQMRMRSGTALLLVALIAGVAALPTHWGGRRKGGFVQFHLDEDQKVHDSRLADSTVTGIARIPQLIDHFNATDKRTFQQRYFFNTENSQNKKSTVNFLYLSGEQTASLKQITGASKPIVQYADKFAANLYCLEHRFYGDSRPFLDTSTENLKYLSSHQAIEDIATFIKTINANSGDAGNQKWVVVGGSYAGALSAWARQIHPDLIVGSIASSAPILAQLDFYGYLQSVENDIVTIPACYNRLKAGVQKISDSFESVNGRNTLDKKFPISPKLATYKDLQDNDIITFFTWASDVFEGASQYGSPDSIDNVCNEFTKKPLGNGYDELDALADVMKKYKKDGFTFDINYTAGVVDLQDTSYTDDPDVNDEPFTSRLWTWQTCTEFGYFQSTDRGDNIFGSTVPVNVYVDQCLDVFGLDINAVSKSIDDTNAYYGGRDYYSGTKVFMAHGTVDPWSYLTKQKGTEQHWSVVVAEVGKRTTNDVPSSGTHCSDLNAACTSDGKCNPILQQVQTLTRENIDQWLNGPFTAPDSIKLTDNVGKRPVWYDDVVKTPLDIRVNGQKEWTPIVPRAKRSVADRLKNRRKYRRNQFTGKTTHHLLPPVEAQRPEWPVNIEEGRVDQPFDHFDPNNNKQFQQRFYVNEMYAKTDANGNKLKTAPNFLMIGGEGPESNKWVTNEKYAWMTYAKEVGANVYILEHRYYGASKLDTTDLQYLTSSQMLYDVARFISIVKRDRSQTGPWITFGGSYPGALAAWSREWFPDLILGAVGSSGPVLAKNEFYEYLQVVEKVLRAKSEKCATRTQEAFDKLRVMTHDASGRSQISKKFNLIPPWTNNVNEVIKPINIQNVFGNIYGVFQDIVQYSDDNTQKGNDYTVSELCSIMEDEATYPDSLDAVRYIQKWKYDDYGNPETGSDPEDDFEELRQMWKYIDGHAGDNSPWDDEELSSLLWTWQTCNEFGYYQSTDYGEGIFGNPVPLNFYITMCEQVFGVSMDHVEKGVARSNYQYGGRARYNATNVVLPNGNHDPWHALGILEQGTLPASVVPILIEGTAHCADMYPARDIELPQLVAARNTILSNIKKWLSGTTPDQPTQPTKAPPPEPTTTTSAGHISTLVAVIAPLAALLVL
ncbi:hypothetical protein PENTCL1PPCAC_19713, partial [Pristionchus entomophagus]